MATRKTGHFFGALALLAVLLPLTSAAGCKLFNKEKKQFGEDCTSDMDCDSLECATYGSVCTKNCSYDKECGSGFVCRARDGRPGDACAKPTGNPNGSTCSAPAECQSGNCLKPVGQGDAVGFCSTHCETADDCPAGHKICLSISDSGALKFCLPGDPAAAATQEPPKFVAPRPVTTTTKTTTTASASASGTAAAPTSTATAAATPTATATAAPTATATAAPTATATATATSTATSRPTSTSSVKRPPILTLPKKK